MNKDIIYIGKIVNTHGIKGELRILSNFEKKEKVFIPENEILIGKEKNIEIINTYRHHKDFEMITLKGYNNINEVLKYKGQSVYIERRNLNLKANDYLYEDLIGLDIYENKEKLGKCKEVVYNNTNILLYIEANKCFYIPLNDVYVKKVDLEAKKINVENARGLII